MIRISLRNLWDHKLRTVLLGLAIVAGVSFVVGSFVFTDSLGRGFDDLFTNAQEGTDITVTPTLDDENVGIGLDFPRIPADLEDDLAAVDGVASVRPVLQSFVVLVVDDEDQQPVGAGFGAPTFGISWIDGPSPFSIREGRAPTAPGEVIIDVGTAESRGIAIGDTVGVAADGPKQDFTVVGLMGFGEADNLLGATFMAFAFEQAEALFEVDGEVNNFDISIEPGADLAATVEAVQAVLPDTAQAIDARAAAEEQAAELQQGLAFFNIFLLVFAGIALVVGAFVVYNAFRVVVAQRTRELALLRVLGTQRSQLVRMVILESVIVGIAASATGVVFGVLLAVALEAILEATGGTLPTAGLVLQPRTVLVGILVGTLTAVASALIPAVRSARIAPMAALRDQLETRRTKPWWTWAGLALGAVAVALVVTGARQASDAGALTGDTGPVQLVGAGAALLFLAFFLLARSVARPALAWLGRPLRSTTGTLARENARRTPRRTATTAAALMIGLGLVATVAIMTTSVEDTIIGSVEEAFRSDLLVQPAGFNPLAGIPDEIAPTAEGLDFVESVARLATVEAELPADQTNFVVGIEPQTVDLVLAFDDVTGSFADLGPGKVAVQQVEADLRGYALGDTIEITILGEPRDYEIVAFFTFAGGANDSQSYYLDYDALKDTVPGLRDNSVSIRLVDGVDLEDGKTRLAAALEDFPSVAVTSLADILEQTRAALLGLVGMIAGLLFMSVIVAVVGIVLTLYLAVIERTHETGLLRAIGMTRANVREMIRWESILIALFGAILGVMLGLFLGWGLSVSIIGPGAQYAVPWLWIVLGFVGAAIAGVLAAIIPSYRATRMDVLEAIAYE